jgi:hypothetical protein
MKHNHHLIPKHLGGTNNPSNIVEGVSVTRHAMFHFANWQLWGSEGDLIAYRALCGSIGKEEIIGMMLSFAGKKGGEIAKESGQLREAALKQPRHVRQKRSYMFHRYGNQQPSRPSEGGRSRD